MSTHIVYLPVHLFVTKADMRVLLNLTVDITHRYNMYVREEIKKREGTKQELKYSVKS